MRSTDNRKAGVMARAIFLSVCLLLMQTAAAMAADPVFDGNKLVSLMNESEKSDRDDPTTNYVDEGVYIGYVMGVYHSHRTEVCPVKAQTSQLLAVVTNYLKAANPAELNNPPEIIVLTALKRAFPCRRQRVDDRLHNK